MSAHVLFAEPWWLDAVTGGSWEQIVAAGPGGSAARLPFVRRRRLGFTVLTQPPLTPTLGPRLTSLPAKPERRIAAEHKLMSLLIAQLPRHEVFQQSFTPGLTNALAFHWAGFETAVRYTYRLTGPVDLERVWEGLSQDHRRKIRAAQETLEVRADLGVPRLYELAAGTLAGKGLRAPYDAALLGRLEAAASQRGACRILSANDVNETVRAAALLVWDDDWLYYLLGGRDLHAGDAGALRMLQWEAVKLAAELGRGVDFAGSMVEPIERVFRGFGAEQVPHPRVSRVALHARPLWALRSIRR